jgi:hypothetical protein
VDPNKPLWEILDIEDTWIFLPQRGQVQAKKVYYTTGFGVQSFVVLPLDKFNDATVKAQIDHDVENMLSVKYLMSDDTMASRGMMAPPPGFGTG